MLRQKERPWPRACGARVLDLLLVSCLEANYYFRSTQECYPCGVHTVHLAVDPETGKIDILKYAVVEDVGHITNPLLLNGQIVGVAAQGLGATILEELVYSVLNQYGPAPATP